jgi:hypothetical protein
MSKPVYACTVFVCVPTHPYRTVNFVTNRFPRVSDVLPAAGIKKECVLYVECDDNLMRLDAVVKNYSTLIVYPRNNKDNQTTTPQ